jgi:hypothetical protein
MKSRMIGIALVSAFALANPLLSFAGGQRAKEIAQNNIAADQPRVSSSRAWQAGKGSGLTREQQVSANAYRSETAQDSETVADHAGQTGARWDDPAFHK